MDSLIAEQSTDAAADHMAVDQNRYGHAIESFLLLPQLSPKSNINSSKLLSSSDIRHAWNVEHSHHQELKDQAYTLKRYSSSTKESSKSHDELQKSIYDPALTVENLQFELQRRDKMILVLNQELQLKDESHQKLLNDYELLKEFTSNIELEQRSDRCSQENRLSTQIALKIAEIETITDQKHRLEQRFSEMEELLRQKDTELCTLQEQAIEREGEFARLARELQACQYQNSVQTSNLLALESESLSKDQLHQQRLRDLEDSYKRQIKECEMQHEYNTAKLVDQIQDIQKQSTLQEKRANLLYQQINKLKQINQKLTLDKKELQTQFIDLEAKFTAASVKNQHAGDFKLREEAYQAKIAHLQESIFSMNKNLLSIQPATVSTSVNKYQSRNSQQYVDAFKPSSSPASPQPIELKHVLTDSVRSSSAFEKHSSRHLPDQWDNIDKWKLDS